MIMPTFQDFRSGPGADIARRIFAFAISNLESWADFRAAVAGASNKPGFLERIQDEIPRMSSSEEAIALAILHAADYGDQADQLDGHFLRLFRQCSGSHRDAALAVLAQED